MRLRSSAFDVFDLRPHTFNVEFNKHRRDRIAPLFWGVSVSSLKQH